MIELRPKCLSSIVLAFALIGIENETGCGFALVEAKKINPYDFRIYIAEAISL